MRTTLIAAADAEWGIGFQGRLPWHCPEDLSRFRSRTLGCALVMGRVTAASVGNRLPGRTILTVSASGMSIEEAVEEARRLGSRECFMAGGRGIYEAALKFADAAEITRIAGNHHCDTWMPDLSEYGWLTDFRERISDRAEVEFWEPRSFR